MKVISNYDYLVSVINNFDYGKDVEVIMACTDFNFSESVDLFEFQRLNEYQEIVFELVGVNGNGEFVYDYNGIQSIC